MQPSTADACACALHSTERAMIHDIDAWRAICLIRLSARRLLEHATSKVIEPGNRTKKCWRVIFYAAILFDYQSYSLKLIPVNMIKTWRLDIISLFSLRNTPITVVWADYKIVQLIMTIIGIKRVRDLQASVGLLQNLEHMEIWVHKCFYSEWDFGVKSRRTPPQALAYLDVKNWQIVNLTGYKWIINNVVVSKKLR